MPGSVALSFTHEPSFREAIEVEGFSPKVIVAENNETVQGVALMARKPVFLDGKIQEIGYLSSLRLDPSVRSTAVLARGYRLLRQLHEADPLPFYLTTIMEENEGAKAILTSGRAGLPTYHPIGAFRTVLLPLVRRRVPLPDGVRILRGEEVGAEPIIDCLHRLGKDRQYFPVYKKEDLLSAGGILRGLKVEDFFVAVEGDRLIGTLACWDQNPFRQSVVTGYSPAMKWVKRGFDCLASFSRMAPLPREGGAFQSLTAACLTAGSPEVFRGLLRTAINARVGTGKTFLTVGLSAEDPWLPVAEEGWHTTLKSLIYAVAWDSRFEASKDRVPYLELGSL